MTDILMLISERLRVKQQDQFHLHHSTSDSTEPDRTVSTCSILDFTKENKRRSMSFRSFEKHIALKDKHLQEADLEKKMAASLRTVSCSRICTGLRCLQLGGRSQFPVRCRNASFFEKFWKGSSKTKPVEDDDIDDLYDFPTTGPVRSFDALQCLRKRSGVSTKKGYSPPHDVEERIQMIANDIYGEKEDWKETQLTDRQNKYQFLTRTIEEFGHDIPNMVLTKLDKVDNVVHHFSTEVRETSALEDISKLDLPKNLHMNLDYIRFHDEKENLFNGKTAFPSRPTIIHSIKHKRQYKGSKRE